MKKMIRRSMGFIILGLFCGLMSVQTGFSYNTLVIRLPDLTVSGHRDATIQGTHKYKVTIKNIGTAPSKRTLVYVQWISLVHHPGVNDIRFQQDFYTPDGFLPSPSSDVSFEGGLSLNDIHRKEISKIRVTVDPKNLIRELNETNNVLELTFRTSGR